MAYLQCMLATWLAAYDRKASFLAVRRDTLTSTAEAHARRPALPPHRTRSDALAATARQLILQRPD